MSSLFFSKAAASRLLPFATKIERIAIVNGAVNVVYIANGKRCSTFLSKKAFYTDFLIFRQEGAKTVKVKRWGTGSYVNHYECFSSKSERIYTVKLVAGLAMCSCPDYERQYQELGKAKTGCKHVIATLNHVGYGSIAEYMDAVSNRAKADLFGGGWDESIRQPSIPTVPTQLVVAQRVPHKTKPAPDPFGGF
jgi:hypothetical protein